MINQFIRNGMPRVLTIGVRMYILEHGEASTIELADHFNVDVVSITRVMAVERKNGYVERIDTVIVKGLYHSITGRMESSNRVYGVYQPTEKLKGFLDEKPV